MRRIIHECYQRAKDLLEHDIEVLHGIAEVLLEKEVLDGAEIDEIIRQCGRTPHPLAATAGDARA